MKSPMPFKPSIPGTLIRILGVLVVAALLIGAVIQTRPAGNALAGSSATCTSIASGDWNNSANWNCPVVGTFPGAGDTAIIDSQDITVSANQAVQDVTVSANAMLILPDAVKLTVGGALHVSQSASLNTVVIDEVTERPVSGGTLEFGPGNQTLDTGGAWLYLWNLTKTDSGILTVNSCLSDTSECEGGFETINNLTLTGAGPSLLSLRSAFEGVTWKFQADKTPTIDFVDVQDSTNQGALINVLNGINSGHNSGWRFAGLTSSQNPSLVEQDVTLTMVLPEGAADTSLAFMEGITKVACNGGNPVSVLNGAASCTTGNLGAGSHIITVSYAAGSKTAQLTQVVSASTNLQLQSNPSPSPINAEVTFTANIMPMGAAGTVNFDDGDTALCTAVVLDANGKATCKATLSVAGSHSITAEYIPSVGDTDGSVSAPYIQSVKNVSTLLLGTSKAHVNVLDSLTFTANISSLPDATGTITFMENGNFIPGCVDVAVVSKQAACSTNALSMGKHVISVLYSGDATNFSATAVTIDQFVNGVIYMPQMFKQQ